MALALLNRKIGFESSKLCIKLQKHFSSTPYAEELIKSSSAKAFANLSNEEIFGNVSESDKKPLYDDASIANMRDDVAEMQELKDFYRSFRPSIKRIDDEYPFRYRGWEAEGFQNKKEEMMPRIRQAFNDRMSQIGLNAADFNDNELRFESMKRDYLRYRRKRNYQKLAEMGILNRRPRRVTKEQYERFLKYKKTQKYPAEREASPLYVRGKNGVVRKDIYERATGCQENIEYVAAFQDLPNLVDQPERLFDREEERKLKDFSPAELGAYLRGKQFATWEKKLEWTYAAINRLHNSRQAYQALKTNLETRLRVIKSYRNHTAYKEYFDLRRSELKRLYEFPLQPFEDSYLEGFILEAQKMVEHFDAKRLMLKESVQETPRVYADKFTERIVYKVLKDKENDENDLKYLEENEMQDAPVVKTRLLQRNQVRLANPDVTRRFIPYNWRTVEKNSLFFVERNEHVNENFKLNEENYNAHNYQSKIFEEPQNKREHVRSETQTHLELLKAELKKVPSGRWATAVLNGVKPRKLELMNEYSAKTFKIMADTLRDNEAAALLEERFPYGRVDLEPSEFESNFLEIERSYDMVLAKMAVDWIIAPTAGPIFGYSWNPFRTFRPRLNMTPSYTWKTLPRANLMEEDNFQPDNSCVSKLFLKRHFVSHSTKMDKIVSQKELWVAGNNNGCVGFGYTNSRNGEMLTEKAQKMAATNMLYAPLYKGRALFHSTEGVFNRTRVKIIATPPGYGLVGPPVLRCILSMCGIRDATCMQFGNNNLVTIVKATMIALSKLTDLESVSWTRGKKLVEVSGEAGNTGYFYPRDYDASKRSEIMSHLEFFRESFAPKFSDEYLRKQEERQVNRKRNHLRKTSS